MGPGGTNELEVGARASEMSTGGRSSLFQGAPITPFGLNFGSLGGQRGPKWGSSVVGEPSNFATIYYTWATFEGHEDHHFGNFFGTLFQAPFLNLFLIDFGPFWGPFWTPLGTPKAPQKTHKKKTPKKS